MNKSRSGCAEFKSLGQRQFSRRDFLKSASVSASGLLLAQSGFTEPLSFLAFAQEPRPADTLIVIFQRGGMDGLSAVIPYAEGSNYYDKRPNIAIPDNQVLDLNGFFGLHPTLAPLKDIYDNGQLAVVHATGSPDPTRSHFDAMEYMERGVPGDKMTPTGWLSRHLQSVPWTNESPLRAVTMGTMVQSSLRGAASALAMQSIGEFSLNGPDHHLQMIQRNLAQMYRVPNAQSMLERQAKDTLSTMSFLSRLSGSEYTPSYEAQYPESDFGRGLRQIAQLIKSEVGLEVACVDIGGWDTHENQGSQDGQFAGLINDLGQGLAAFHNDMQDYMDRVTVVTMSEFGRRLEENASAGTDHGHGNCMFVMGSGVNGGVYTDWPTLAPDALDDGDLKITIDYRDILSEILVQRMSNPVIDQIFPNYTLNMRGIMKPRGA
jgi:uncharacterized protein (DUF1501 family)